MSDVAIVAFGAVSALGEGDAAVSAGTLGEPARGAIAPDPALARAGLARPWSARVAVPDGEPHRATWLLLRAMRACMDGLDRDEPGWRSRRVGLVLGTSSGGMRQAEHAFAALDGGLPVPEREAATYHGPMAEAVRATGMTFSPAQLVLGACASSTLAVGLGCRWLEGDTCDLVLAGGFDEVTAFVAAGFESLGAITAHPPPRPFGVGRDGMALGEGAGVVALARRVAGARVFVRGFAAASDAVHLTAPDREGRALARAVADAMAEAHVDAVEVVSPHATATPFNDPVDAKTIASLTAASPPVVTAFKAQIGHTLGAAGALELLHAADAMKRGVLPAVLGSPDVDPAAHVRLLERAQAGVVRRVLKTSAAFGGVNAGLVLGTEAGKARSRRPSYASAAVHVRVEPDAEALAQAVGVPAHRLGRADALVRLSVAALAALRDAGEDLDGAGLVTGSALATVETNARFARGLRERGGRGVEPRLFAYTSPNAVAGECTIAFRMTGPSFGVGAGLHAGLEALATASLLVESGDADRIAVVAVDDRGPVSEALVGPDGPPSGAVALVVSASETRAWGRVTSATLVRGAPSLEGPAGHLALLPLVAPVRSPRGPLILVSASPPDAFARVLVEPLPV